ncbi:MAG: ribosome-associated translation inhibitor RaiA [Rhodospirillales bacterium]|nr:ribosome-associated translation inhibitor RaiA [Alphaproteobacteria bacterium]MCB9986898.1 ribosome-associated translation inhibitor RaiA [Rhodospirillales bacterium]USO08324.1 MAG: ribosome-associated translation inhibitor RaiA [Rhodospirillales bacterium]
MNLSVKGQHVDVGEALRAHIEEKMENLKSKYFNRVTTATVFFSREGHYLFRSAVTFHVGHDIKVQATSENADAYAAFDDALERVGKQLRRYKTRLRDHHERLEKTPESAYLQARDYTLQTDEADLEENEQTAQMNEPQQLSGSEDHVIIAETTTQIPALSVSEAVMRMDLADQDFMLFKNAKSGGLNVVYRRPDGHIGWVDPSMTEGASSTRAA